MAVLTYRIVTEIIPSGVDSQALQFDYPFEFNLSNISLNISDPIKQTAFEFLNEILENYIDEDRELKTLLNFGEDHQNVIIARRYGPPDATGTPTLQLKLLNPIPDDISSQEDGNPNAAFISTEVANSVIQNARFFDAPPIDRTPYLRSKNTNITINEELGRSLKNVTLNVLNLDTGSVGGLDQSSNVSFEDSIFRRWYSYDFNSSELNIDFTNYNNFVFYGSAAMRLQAFRQKLLEIEKLTLSNLQFEGSVFTGSLATAGASYILQQSAKFSKEKEDIIRSFDRYEQYLYFTPSGSNSPYSASFEFVDGGTEFNQIGYWPKQSNGTLFPVSSEEATMWFDTQIQIAQRFDEFNENNLINTIPTHIREHDENAPYFTFVVMIGHFFDTIKPYIDQFPEIYSRYIDPDQELSKDLVDVIAESVGFRMPTIDSIYSLSQVILGTGNNKPRRDFTVESYKRLLHNLPYFAKTKGSRTSLRALLRTLGITEELIDIQESGVPDENAIKVFSEFYNAIKFEGNPSYIKLPIAGASRTPFPRSIQLNVSIGENKNMTILTGDDLWSLNVKRHLTNQKLIKIELFSNTEGVILETKYFQNVGKNLLNISIRTYDNNSNTKLRVLKVDQEAVVIDEMVEGISGVVSDWNNTDHIYVGGSGSLVIDNFIGEVDEIRVWGINLSDKLILTGAFDPPSNAGDVFTDASDFLYIQVSLNKLDSNLFLSGSIINESPYIDISDSPSLETLDVVGFTVNSLTRSQRYVKQSLLNTGGLSYISNKVRIAPPPIFKFTNGAKRLFRTKSIVSLNEKSKRLGGNKVNISASPTNIINQNIIRNLGSLNVNRSYGIPNESYNTLPNTLKDLQDHYNKFYYINVNKNRFIRIISSVSSVINQLIDYFIPSRASAMVGVTIEPTALERTKIDPIRKIKFYGIGSRRTNNVLEDSSLFRKDYEATFTLSDEIYISNELVSGSYLTKDIIIDANKETKLIVSSSALDANTANTKSTVSALTANIDNIYENISGSISAIDINFENFQKFLNGSYYSIGAQHSSIWNIAEVIRSARDKNDPNHIQNLELVKNFPKKYREAPVSINLGYDKINKIGFSLGNGPRFGITGVGKEGAEPYGRIYARKLFEYEISRPRSGGVTSLIRSALYSIKPSCDLEEFGSRNFFGHPFGVYYFSKKIKTPFYSNPLNATWNVENQEFTGATTWSYGTRYNINDVVFQDIQYNTADANTLGEDITKSAISGNNNFYVFKIPSAQINSIDLEEKNPVYLGGIPSTLPPSLDKNNWSRLRFIPRSVPIPKRVVFDTFIVQDPVLNDFRTTTLDVERRIDIPNRFVDLFSVGNVPTNSRKFGEIAVQNIYALFAVQLSTLSGTIISPNIRLRFYRTTESRNSDVLRPLYGDVQPNSGLLLDMNITEYETTKPINPIVTLVSGDVNFDGTIYYTIDNLSSSPSGFISLYLYYYAIQIEPRLPVGYLRKHYRYFRDTTTATKRRNFEGCKNTENTTIDGLPSIQIFLSEDSDITVSPTLENSEIEFGGGGTFA
jgi:hypothetical protein